MNHKIIKLGIAAAVAVLLATWIGNVREPRTTGEASKAVAPGLKDSINEIKTVRVTGAESKPIVTLVKGANGWTVVERSGYPADLAKLRELLLKLADADLVEPKTTNPEAYAKLGVEDIAAKDAKSVLLEVEGGKEPIKLIVGNFNGRGGDGTFVRRAGDKQSWLAQGNLTVDKTAANWLQRDLADLPSSRIAEVAIVANGKTLRAFKNDAAEPNFQVADLPKGRELSSEFAANALASVLAGLRFDDVAKDDPAQPGTAKVYDVKYTGFDGLVVTSQAWEADTKSYARFAASLDEARANASVDAAQTKAKAEFEAANAQAAAMAAAAKEPAAAAPGAGTTVTAVADPTRPLPPLAVTDPAKDRDERLARQRKEVDDLNAKFKGWTFVLPSYKFANMNKSVEDMLKPLEPKK